MFDQLQGHLFKHFLHAGSVMDVRLISAVISSSRAKPVDKLLGKIKALSLLFVTSKTDGVHHPGINPEIHAVKFNQWTKIEFVRITIGCHAHDFVLTIEHFKEDIRTHLDQKTHEQLIEKNIAQISGEAIERE